MSKLDFIKKFINIGISIIPLHHRSKEPSIPAWHPYQHILSTDQEVRTWFPTDWCNYGVIAGWCNLVIIDFDNIEYFNVWQLVQRDLSETAFKVRTRKGIHVYVRTEAPVANDKRISKSAGIDVQAQGKYVVGPGCTHPNGTQYQPIGEMVFPVVRDIETILPLDLFPRVAAEKVEFIGAPARFQNADTEYQYDPFAVASMVSDADLITKVKQSVRIENLFSSVVRTSVDGRWLAAVCPFHDDSHPSFWIDTARQLCGCNVCGMKPMDAINLYSRMHNVSESVAVGELAKEIGVWA